MPPRPPGDDPGAPSWACRDSVMPPSREPVAERPRDGPGPARDVDLAVDARRVTLDGVDADPERPRDLVVGEPAYQRGQPLALARGQQRRRRIDTRSLRDPCGPRVARDRPAAPIRVDHERR